MGKVNCSDAQGHNDKFIGLLTIPQQELVHRNKWNIVEATAHIALLQIWTADGVLISFTPLNPKAQFESFVTFSSIQSRHFCANNHNLASMQIIADKSKKKAITFRSLWGTGTWIKPQLLAWLACAINCWRSESWMYSFPRASQIWFSTKTAAEARKLCGGLLCWILRIFCSSCKCDHLARAYWLTIISFNYSYRYLVIWLLIYSIL